MNRLSSRLFSAAAAIAFAGAVGSQAGAADKPAAAAAGDFNPRDVTGVWQQTGVGPSSSSPVEQRILKTADGKPVPMLPWLAKEYQAHIDAELAGRPLPTNMAQCLPTGMPKVTIRGGYPIQILDTKGQLTFIYEESAQTRIVHMDRGHLPDPDPSYYGDEIGHWEGDTLVIDTTGLNDKTDIDQIGMAHTDKMHVTEHIRRVDKDHLDVVVTLDDPGAFSHPFDIKRGYRREAAGTEIREYVCAENNRNPIVNGVQATR